MNKSLCYVTITVKKLDDAKEFYEDLCGFVPDINYEPTRWQAYEMEDMSGGFAIMEAQDFVKHPSGTIVDFFVKDVAKLWEQLKAKARVVEKLRHTPWESYKFVIEDPDGNRLGFVQR